MASTPSLLYSPEPSWQPTWHAFENGGCKPQAPIPHQYVDMRQERRTFKSVASDSCDWLFSVLAIKVQGATFIKTNGKVDKW